MHHSSFDNPAGYQPSLDHSTPHHTYLPQQSNSSLTVQDLPTGDTTDMSKPVDDDDMISIDNATNQPLQVNVVHNISLVMM